MSAPAIVTPQGPVQRFQRRRSRLSRPGVSLSSQGEPLIWLTGGALVTCVLMIAGLLMLVIWFGFPTFWPSPLIEFTLSDGEKHLGEVTRTDSFELTSETLRSLSPAEVKTAEKILTKRPRTLVTRWLVRTGNYELSGEHFRWISELAAGRRPHMLPEWAITVERMEWGRFYGIPLRFTVREPHPNSENQRKIREAATFLERQRSVIPENQVDELQKLVAIVRESTAAASPGSRPAGAAETWTSPSDVWQQYLKHHQAARNRHRERRSLERDEIGDVNSRIEEARLSLRALELEYGISVLELANELAAIQTTIESIQDSSRHAQQAVQIAKQLRPATSTVEASVLAAIQSHHQKSATQQLAEPTLRLKELEHLKEQLPPAVLDHVESFLAIQKEAANDVQEINERIRDLNEEDARFEFIMKTASGQEKILGLGEIVRAYPANQLTLTGKLQVYADRWWEFLSDEPREANSEGGILPAIWGTVAMTLVMSLLVVPFGVLASLYLREYAKSGWIVSIIRIAISNLAGVPSIVFGVFGLGFFCYLVGAFIDGGPVNAGIEPLPPATWWGGLVALAAMGVGAFALGLWNMRRDDPTTKWYRRWLSAAAMTLWIAAVCLAIYLIFATPYFGGFFPHLLPNPKFGKGGIIWASLTLALLTLPVVIVATEEALSAVPNSLREGSYACGASKWQTIRRIVLPHAMPGIMTGMILAMARGAGEVAPLMLVGAVKLQPELPVDGEFPFVHLSRSFMHLGFQIYDLGFQSPNSEAAKPMVFTTTVLLISLIACLNLTAIWVRSRLRKRFQMGQF